MVDFFDPFEILSAMFGVKLEHVLFGVQGLFGVDGNVRGLA